MTINFQCQGCQELFAVPDAMAGKRVRCNICEVEQEVPMEGALVDFEVAREPRVAATVPSGAAALTPIAATAPRMPADAPTDHWGQPQWAGLSLGVWIWMVGGLMILSLFMMIITAMYVRFRGPAPNRRIVTVNQPGPARDQRPAAPFGVEGNRGGSFESARPSASPFAGSQDQAEVSNAEAPDVDRSQGTDAGKPPPAENEERPADPDPDGEGNPAEVAPADEPLPLIRWTAQADPTTRKVEPKLGKLTIPVQSFQGVYFPVSASNYVLLAARVGISDVYQVFDLRNGNAIGKSISGDLDAYGEPVFSPDGRYAAARLRPTAGTKVGVWSFVDGASKHEIQISDNSVTPSLYFAGDHQLITTERVDFYSLAVKRWNLESGEMIDQMTIQGDRENAYLDDSMAVSQDGRYLAFVVGGTMSLVDLVEGGYSGQAELPERPSKCLGMTFRADGQQLAGLFSIRSGDQLISWDCSSGKMVVDRRYNQAMPTVFYDGHPLEWTADNSGLVFQGHILLEGSSGEAIWNFPKTTSAARRMIHPDRLLVVMRDSRSNEALDSVKIPDDEIAKAIEAVHAGGAAVDAALPPLTTPDLFAAKKVDLPNGFVNWSASVDAAPSDGRTTSRDILVADEGNRVHQVMFAGESGKVVLRKEIASKLLAGRSVPAQFTIERYDMASGKRGNQLDVPSPYRLIDVSLSGSHALVGFYDANSQFERLDVLSLAPKKHIAGWRPYSSESDDQKPVRTAIMVSDTVVLTCNSAGRLVAWQMPECKAIYSIDGFGQVLSRSPTKRFVIGQQQGTTRIYESMTGQCRGDLMRPKAGVSIQRTAYHPSGKKLAAIVGSAADKTVVIWDLQSGQIMSEFPVSSQMFAGAELADPYPDSLVWRGDRHLFLDHHYLIDTEGRAVVWQYELPDGMYTGWCSGTRQWYVTPQDSATAVAKPYYLTYVDLPSSSVQRKTELMKLENQLLMAPGTRVRLDLQLAQPGEARVVQSVRKSLTDRLEANRVVVDPNATMTLSVTTRERDTGTRIGVGGSRVPFRPFGPGGGMNRGPSISQKRLECVLALVDPSGVTRWSWSDGVTMRPFGAAQQTLQQEMVTRFSQFLTQGEFARVALPKYVFGDLQEILGGTSYLTIEGEGSALK